jgi:subtilisin family serine protease
VSQTFVCSLCPPILVDSYGPFSDDAIEALLTYVKLVHGEGFSVTRAVTPADIPQECFNPQPDACPAQGLYGLNMIRAPAVWSALRGTVNQNPTVRTMVLDSGVQPTHADLRPNLEPGLSVHFGNAGLTPNPPFDADEDSNHGTHVCGTVFAAHNNGRDSAVGIVGNALGISCGCSGDFPDTCVARCVQHARTNRARVINMSFGRGRPERLAADNIWRDQIERFCDQGGLIFVAAGNDALEVPNAPLPDGSIGIGYPEAFVQDLRRKVLHI